MKLLRDNGHAHCLNSAKQYNQIDNCAVISGILQWISSTNSSYLEKSKVSSTPASVACVVFENM